MKKLKLAVLGLGRIGMTHVRNIKAKVANATLVAAYDPYLEAKTLSQLQAMGVKVVSNNLTTIINHPAVDAFVICSPTATHIDLIKKIIKTNNKPIFCEKPLALHWQKTAELIKLAKAKKSFVQVGFNRRFDSNFQKVQQAVASKKIGQPYLVSIASYDPAPPPLAYVKAAGMIWNDMNIHDFDMLRFVLGSEVEEVFVRGANLIDPAFQGVDVDVTTINLRFKNGALGSIRASRKAAYGYDQRIEVLGAKGRAKIDNVRSSTFKLDSGKRRLVDNPLHFFMERYKQAYVAEMRAFAAAVLNGSDPLVTVNDDLAASKIAAACQMSYQQKRPIKIASLGR